MSNKKFTITSALPYANGPIHLGHLAGAYIPADIFNRFLKQNNIDSVFVCGSDEHGAAITIRAKKENVKPQEIIDKYHNLNKLLFEKFNIEFDIYDRTSDTLHHKTAQDFFIKLIENDSLKKMTTQQFYDEKNNIFLADRYIKGTCPKCNYDEAYGDQCEKCGSSLSPNELINPYSTLSGEKPILKDTEHWFLPMAEHENWLKDWINDGVLDGKKLHDPKKWRKNVLGQCMSWINNGLTSRAMTRDLDWGVKVPIVGADNKVLYVWLDAPIGYITATKKWAELNNKNWEDYWKSDNTEIVHFIGKDNIVFHCIIFPILLKQHGEYKLPKNIPANEFLNLEGKKISTSRNWAIWVEDYINRHPNLIDEMRYILTANMPDTNDTDYRWEEFQSRINSDLVGTLGNFINRVLVLNQKYYDGFVPKCNKLEDIDSLLIQNIEIKINDIKSNVFDYKFKESLYKIIDIARDGNKYLADLEPWKLIKNDEERVATIMNICTQLVAHLAFLIQPVMPNKSKQLFNMLSIDTNNINYYLNYNFFSVNEGHKLGDTQLLFNRIEDDFVIEEKNYLNQISNINNNMTNNEENIEEKQEVTFDEFSKMDIRIAKVISAEKVEKTDKLMKLNLELDNEIKTVVSGIALHYSAEQLIGKQVVYLANLSPRKIRGIESNGMILMAENKDSKLSILSPIEDFINSGDKIS